MYCFYFCHVFGMKIIFFYENEISFLFGINIILQRNTADFYKRNFSN